MICRAAAILLLATVSLPATVSAQAPAGPAPKKLLFLTHAALYTHTNLGPESMRSASAVLTIRTLAS